MMRTDLKKRFFEGGEFWEARWVTKYGGVKPDLQLLLSFTGSMFFALTLGGGGFEYIVFLLEVVIKNGISISYKF